MRLNKLYKINDKHNIFICTGAKALDDLLTDELVTEGYCLFHPAWLVSYKSILMYVKYSRNLKRKGISLIILCNEISEQKKLQLFGVKTQFFNQNIHESENEYNIVDAPKIYNAIYIAQAAKFKRLSLASKIKKLYVLTYNCKTQDKEGNNDLHAYEPSINNCDYNKSFIHGTKNVSNLISSAHCGLALSKKEGAMWAVMQYLLCGIPIVTTKSKGGRDYFLNDLNSMYVKDDALAIANMVEVIKKQKISPQLIRESVIEQIKLERLRFMRFLKSLTNEKISDEELMNEIYNHPTGIKHFEYIKK
ncbi:hypothetical protein N8013_01465 [Algibacter sp.]|nr:hypothetical protein [Algibacter sp.]